MPPGDPISTLNPISPSATGLLRRLGSGPARSPASLPLSVRLSLGPDRGAMVPNQASLGVLSGDLQEAGLCLGENLPLGGAPGCHPAPQLSRAASPLCPVTGGPEEQPPTPAPTPSAGRWAGRFLCFGPRSAKVTEPLAPLGTGRVGTTCPPLRPAAASAQHPPCPDPAPQGLCLCSPQKARFCSDQFCECQRPQGGRPGDAGPEGPPLPQALWPGCAACWWSHGNQQGVTFSHRPRAGPRSPCPSPDPSASRRPQVRPSIILPRE